MSQPQSKSREFVTKEIFIAFTPLIASYVWNIFFEAGYSQYFGIPFELISIDVTDVFLTNHLTIMAAVFGFLWIGLYYNIMPSFRSLTFKIFMTLFLILSIGIGTFYGYYYARKAEYFYKLNTPGQPEVVLRIYDGKIVSAPFDEKSRTVYKEFHIHNIGDEPNLSLSYLHLGPLQPMGR